MTALAIIVLVAAAADEPAKVRASHRVDVIAPGEKVETVLDRMRAGKPPSPPSDAQKPGDRLPVRPPDGARPDHPPGDAQPGQQPMHGAPGKGGPPGPPPGPPHK